MEFSEKNFPDQKKSVFTLFFDDFPDFLNILGMQKKNGVQKIETFGNPITNSSFHVLMGLNHPVSERIRLMIF